MFTRLTIEIAKLSEFEQLDLLRKMAEGVLTIDAVIAAPGTNGWLRLYADKINLLDTAISNLSNSMMQDGETNNPGYAVLNEYKQLPIQQRVSGCDEYQAKLLKYFNRNSSALNKFDRIKLQDTTIIYAVDLLVGLLACSLYNNLAMPTADQIKLLQMLKSDPLAKMTLKNDATSASIKRFQMFYRILINSYLSEDKQKFIQTLTARMFDFECQYRTPLNKTISLLCKMKKDFTNDYVDKLDAKFLFFGSKTPENVIVLRRIFEKLPAELNLLHDDGNQNLKLIRDVFTEAFAIIKDEKSQTFLRKHELNQFWTKLHQDMQDVIREEGNTIGIQAKAKVKAGM